MNTSNQNSAALISLFLALPFVLLNTIANYEIEPFYTFFMISSPGSVGSNPFGFLALIVSLFLLPVAVVVAARPMFQKGADGKRRVYVINFILAAIIFVFFAMFLGAWIAEIYRCDVLHIPNCD